MMMKIVSRYALGLFLLAGCLSPGDDRVLADMSVGRADVEGLNIRIENGLAAIRSAGQEELTLWAQAPAFSIEVTSLQNRPLKLEILNCMPDAVGLLNNQPQTRLESQSATRCLFDLSLPSGSSTILIAPSDWNEPTTFSFADMGDIQRALSEVDDIFQAISDTPELRFVMSTGDITESAAISEYDLFEEKLSALSIPYFSTIGNHELTNDFSRWTSRFGLFSIHFEFKGVRFSFVDSGNASISPLLQERLDRWLETSKDAVHIFGTHYPLIDPVGSRGGDFRSRLEGHNVLAKLVKGNVDLALYGHIHSYYNYDNAGVPSVISGGGGALPERFDGVDRHFLKVTVSAEEGSVDSVERCDLVGRRAECL